jgi:hypothetical protein
VRNHLGSNKYFILIADIDLNITPYNSGEGWVPIGSVETPFSGNFDGNGKTLSHLYINKTEYYNGLFGHTGATTNISNLQLTDVSVKGDVYTGGLVGSNFGTITNCHVTGTVTGIYTTGGLVGENRGRITLSSSAVIVTGSEDNTGGLVGLNFYTSSIIETSYATCAVTGKKYSGGLVGQNLDGGRISKSYATGAVTGKGDYSGGLVGQIYNGGSITYSYSTGAVTGISYCGGLVGYKYNGTVNTS